MENHNAMITVNSDIFRIEGDTFDPSLGMEMQICVSVSSKRAAWVTTVENTYAEIAQNTVR